MATQIWNAGNGFWDITANWQNAVLPGENDDIVVNVAADITVTHRTGNTVINSLLLEETLALIGGSLSVEASSTIKNFTLAGGTLSGSGTLLADNFTWTQGRISDGTTLVINQGGTLNTNFTNSENYLHGQLKNQGTATWLSGTLRSRDAGVWDNTATGIAELGDVYLQWWFGSDRPTVSNAGAFRKTTGTGTATIEAAFNNTGAVEVQSGTLAFNGGGTSNGIFQTRTNSILQLGGTHTLNDGARFLGEGVIQVLGTASLVGTSTATSKFELTGGTLSGSGTLLADNFTWTRGRISDGTTLVINQGGTLNTNFTSSENYLHGQLKNQGTATWLSGTLRSRDAGVWDNTATGIAELGDVYLQWWFGSDRPTVSNAGAFRKTTGTGTATIEAAFNNTGAVEVQSGTLAFNGGGTSNGIFQTRTNSILQLGGTHTLNDGARFLGEGVTQVLGTASLVGTSTATSKFELTGGTLSGSGTLLADNFTWTRGRISDGTTLVINQGGTLNTNFTSSENYLHGQLKNQGTATWLSGTLRSRDAGVWDNTATGITELGDVYLQWWFGSDRPTVSNAGAFRKTTGTGTATIEAAFNNTGTVEVQSGTLAFNGGYIQTAGLTRLNGGGLSSSSLLDIQGGELDGYGTVSASVANAGVFNPGIGIGALSIAGNYSQTDTGALNIELSSTNAGTGFDQLNVIGIASLNGTLNVSLLDGFAPTVGDTFQILNATSVTGTFTNIQGMNLGNGILLTPTIANNSLILTAIQDTSYRPGVLSFRNTQFKVNENGTPITAVTVLRTGGTDGIITATIAPSAGTATAPEDFNEVPVTVTFAPGETSKTVTIPVVNDTIYESDETINLALSSSSNGVTVGTQNIAVLTIVDDDAKPGILAFRSPTYSVNEDGTTTAAVTINRTGGSNKAVSTTVFFSNGTTTATADYNSTPIVVNFAEGETSKMFAIPIVDDAVFEFNETVNLFLGSPTGGAAIGSQNSAVLTIIDDDTPIPGTLAFSRSDFSVNEDGIPVLAVTITRTGGSDGAVAVTLTPSNGTAIAPADYSNDPITVAFADGETSKTVTIPTVDDTLFELDETIALTLSNPTNGASLGSQTTATLTILNNDPPQQGILAFSSPTYSVNEDGTPVATVTVTRTGGSDGAVSADLVLSDSTARAVDGDYIASLLTVSFAEGDTTPKTVTVPITNDTLVEGTETLNLALANPTGGATLGSQTTAVLAILDDDVQLNFGAANYTVREDGTVIGNITVTRTGRTTGAISATIAFTDGTAKGCTCAASSVNNDFHNAPFTITLADGETSKVIPVELASLGGTNAIRIREDAKAEGDEFFTISLTNPSVGATIGRQDNARVTILDNDTELAFSAPTFSVKENGEAIAAVTVTRTGQLAGVVGATLNLSGGTATYPDDYTQNVIDFTMEAGVTSRVIQIPVRNDLLVEPDETVTLTLSNPTEGASIGTQNTATLTIVDNGSAPALSVSLNKSLIAENAGVNAAIGTVTRNIVTDQDLVVTLTSSDTTEATLPTQITILANQASATFNVAAIDDGTADGIQNVAITASATGYSNGTNAIAVSDINVPDLVVSSLTATTPLLTSRQASLSYRVENRGLTAASPTGSSQIVDRIYLSRDAILDSSDTLLSEPSITATIPAGQFYERNIPFFTPTALGQYYLIAQTDATNVVNEGGGLGDSNNRTITPITISPAYRAVVSTNTEIGIAGNPVTLRGQALSNADGTPVPFEFVTVGVKNNGFVRELSAFTDANGNFVKAFNPLPGEGGTYDINAYFPNYAAEDVGAEDSFKLLGMRFNTDGVTHKVIADQTFTGQVNLRNLADIGLNGIAYTVEGAPSDWNIQVNAPSTLTASGLNSIGYTITAPNTSLITQDAFNIRLTSAEGATATLPVNINLERITPRLVASTNLLTSGMLRGQQTFVEVNVTNQGGAAAENIQVLLPDAPWLKLASPTTISALAPGQSAKVTLALTPDATLPLTEYQGNVFLDAAGNDGDLSLPFNFRAISEAVGSLRINVADELTYFAEGSPKLANATVILRDYFTGNEVRRVTTDQTGMVGWDGIAEGAYKLEVKAEDHDGFEQTIQLDAGEIEEVNSFLSRQTVKYVWTVTPTEIEDRYTISVDSVFKTDVPIPTVVIDPPVIDLLELQTVGQVMQINMTLTNHGLIAANDINLSFGEHPFYKIEPLINGVDTLTAKSSVTIPVRITRIADFDTLVNSSNELVTLASQPSVPCNISGSASYSYECEDKNISKSASIYVNNVEGNCGSKLPINKITPNNGISGGKTSAIQSEIPVIINNKVCDDPYDFDNIEIKLRTFIPSPGIAFNPPILSDGRFEPIPTGSGDGRSFSYSGGTNRSLQQITVTVDPKDSDGVISSPIRSFGSSSLYSGGLNVVGKPWWWRETIGDPILTKTVEVNDDNNSIKVYRVSDKQVNVELIIDAPNPIVPGPAINSRITLGVVQVLGKEPQVFFVGGHDGFPAYELYINKTPVYLYSPVEAGEDPLDLFPPEDWVFSGNWTPKNHSSENQQVELLPQGLLYNSDSQHKQLNRLLKVENLELSTASQEESACATVRISINQDAVMTRSAFLGELEIDNGTNSNLGNISVSLQVKDAQGNVVNNLFGITNPTLKNITAVDGTGILTADDLTTPQDEGIGSAAWTFIPTNLAALDIPTQYSIGGTLSYTESGQLITVPLLSTPVTVFPQAELYLDYFQERNVYADDPFTEAIEASVPFSLGVLVRNEGKGAAKDFRITSAQPKIVDNEKGLLIDFQIVDTQVNGIATSPSLSLNFGNIAAGKTAIADWSFTSPIQGKFADYKASFQHVNDLGKPELSLIKETKIHELVHQVRVNNPTDDGLPDFLVNDTFDDNFYPDTLYFSNGGTAPVNVVTITTLDGEATLNDLQVQVTATTEAGWSYLRLADPANGQFQIQRVLQADGTEILLDNIWRTDRTFPAKGRPTYENILHFLDYNATPGSQTYTVVYTPGGLTLTDIIDVIPDPRSSPVSAITVEFSEAINTSTFDFADLSLTRDGSINLITNAVTITPLSATRYQIAGLTDLTHIEGDYQLTVNAMGINNLSGKAGTGSLTETWINTATGAADTIAPIVTDILDLQTKPRNTPISSLDVTLSEAIDLSTFTGQDITLTRDGGTNLITNGITVSFVNNTTYRINGLNSLTTLAGTYTLTVNGSAIQDFSGNAGSGIQSETWVMDTTSPVVPSNLVISDIISSGIPTPGQTRIATTTPTITGELGETGLQVFFFDLATNQSLGQATVNGTQFSGMVQLPSAGVRNLEIRVQDAAGNRTTTPLNLFVDLTPQIVTTPGITLAQTFGNTTVTEGGISDTYTLALNTRPTSNVTIALSISNQLQVEQPTLTFTPDNWNTPQAVNLSAVDDIIPEAAHSGIINHAITSTDLNYSSLTLPPLTVAIADNDVEIQGTKWHDLYGNGVRDAGEPGLQGWKIYLDTNTNGQFDIGETSVETDANGNYRFTNLRPDTYTVAEVMQEGWRQTFPAINVTTTASSVQLYSPSIPETVTNSTVSTTASQLVSLNDFRNDLRFAGIDGRGFASVIIDTGIDLNHPFFGSDANGDGVSDRIVYQYDFADNDNDASDRNGHGSHVSSIIGSSDGTYTGIAPKADIIALKVFKDSSSGYFSDLEESLQWVIRNADTHNIASVNLSLGDERNWGTDAGRYGIGDELAALATKGIIVTTAAGNNFAKFGSNQGLAYPAADLNTIAVGAIWSTNDQIADFSQRHKDLLEVFAPGIPIVGANANGGTQALGGTSQAAPHIAGIAVLAQQVAVEKLGRKLTVDEFRQLLETTSDLINDGDDEVDSVTNTGLNFPRVNMLALAEGILKLNRESPTQGSSNSNTNSNNAPLYLPNYPSTASHTVTLTAGQTATGVDFGNQRIPVPGTLSFSAAEFSVNEDGSAIAAVTVTRTEGSDGLVSATINLTDGTAKAPSDYSNTPIPITFGDGETVKTVNIQIVNDSLVETNETIQLSLINPTDGATIGTQSTATLTIIDDNNAPVNLVPGSQTIDEDTVLIFSAATGNAISLGDVDAGNAPVQLTLNSTNGRLQFGSLTNLSNVIGDGTATITATGTLANLNAALNELQFTPNADFNGIAILTITTDDLGNTGAGGARSDTDLINITVNPVNDAPVNSLPSREQSVRQGTSLVFSSAKGNRIEISDVDAGNGIVQVSLSVTNGALALGRLTGLTLVEGNNTSNLKLQGTLPVLNSTLNGLRFTPDLSAVSAGAVTLTIDTNDLGNTGSQTSLREINSLSIKVTPANPITGTARNNRLYGSSGNDFIRGLAGNDDLYGNGGNDILLGGNGNDILYGAGGDDLIEGGAGKDIIFGGLGKDTIFGGTGNDWIDGGAGNDVILTGAGRNVISLALGQGFDRVKDFADGRDRVALGIGLRFEQLTIRQQQNDVLISRGSKGLMLLENINVQQITQLDFI